MRSVNLRKLTLLLLCSLVPVSCKSLNTGADAAFITAARQADETAIRAALEKGANPNTPPHPGETNLGILIQQYKRSSGGQKKAIERSVSTLLQKGADPEALHHGFTPLQIATGQGSEAIVSDLITYGANPSAETAAGYAPIWQTVYDNNYRIGQQLLQAGADPNTLNHSGQTPLQYLRERGFKKTKLMLQLRHFGGN